MVHGETRNEMSKRKEIIEMVEMIERDFGNEVGNPEVRSQGKSKTHDHHMRWGIPR
jgi:hypothetical protein